MTHMYDGFVDEIAKAFAKALSDIKAEHNFEYGDEFEIALIEPLRRILPTRFGVCRGFVVSKSGTLAGDDIIIYERILFPTARFLGDDISRLERVPVEAAVAYIEAKHTLEINGESPSSLSHALEQAARVKQICDQRDAVPLNQITRHINLGTGFDMPPPKGWPARRDAFYTAIVSRYVRINPGEDRATDPDAINHAFEEKEGATLPPDLIIAGDSNVSMPYQLAATGTGGTIDSPFTLPTNSGLACYPAPNIAFGVGICHMLWALDFISLGQMPWAAILGDALGIEKAIG